jgi:hypothetical protein
MSGDRDREAYQSLVLAEDGVELVEGQRRAQPLVRVGVVREACGRRT